MSDLLLSQDDLETLADSIPEDLPPDVLKRDLGDLVRRYVLDGRSAALARRVVRYCQALYLHPGLRDSPDEQDAFRDLAVHWRRLRAQIGAGEPRPRISLARAGLSPEGTAARSKDTGGSAPAIDAGMSARMASPRYAVNASL